MILSVLGNYTKEVSIIRTFQKVDGTMSMLETSPETRWLLLVTLFGPQMLPHLKQQCLRFP